MLYREIDALHKKLVDDCQKLPEDLDAKPLLLDDFTYQRATEEELIKIIQSNPSHLYICYCNGRDNALRALERLTQKISLINNDKIVQTLHGVYIVVYAYRWDVFS